MLLIITAGKSHPRQFPNMQPFAAYFNLSLRTRNIAGDHGAIPSMQYRTIPQQAQKLKFWCWNSFKKNDNSFTDNILFHIQKISRIKDLFIDDYSSFKLILIILFCIFLLLIAHFIISCLLISRKSSYNYNVAFINLYIKIFFL